MSITKCLSRIEKIHEDLKGINRLQRLKDMSGKSLKPCACRHHKSVTKSRCANITISPGRLKNEGCSCKTRAQLCMCNLSDEDEITIADASGDKNLKKQSEIIAKLGKQQKDVRDASKSKVVENSPAKADVTKRVEVEIQTTVDKSASTESEKSQKNDKDIEQMYKDLENRNRELEKKLEQMTCSIECLKNEGDERANCLRESLEKSEIQAKLAERSRDLAMDLAKQSRDQTDAIKASRDDVLQQIGVVKNDYEKIQCECDELRSKLRNITENEAKKCAEVDDKVNRIKCAVKQKEMALACEKSELEETVAELTNLVKIQKKRMCDLTSICAKQRSALQNNENCMSSKIAQLSEAENTIQSLSCKCKKLQEEMDCLKCCLTKEEENRKKLQSEYDQRRENCDCELRIKDKIIADQVETIKKLKKFLQDSEKMANQTSEEFETLRDELHCLKQTNASLRCALENAETRTSATSEDSEMDFCERCRILEERLDAVDAQKHKAVAAAKFAAEKLRRTKLEYERLLDCEKKQHRLVAGLVHRRETEIELLKREILHSNKVRNRVSNYVVQ